MKIVISFVMVMAIMSIVSVTGSAQRIVSNDSRRTIYSGNVAPLSVYELPMWTGTSSQDGMRRTTVRELGWDNSLHMVWNEAGTRAMRSQLKPDAWVWVMNGEANPVEGYLEGCIKNGRPFMNRVRLIEVVTTKIVAPTETICTNGTLNRATGKCEVNGEMDLVCPDPKTRLNEATGKCEMVGESAVICDKPGYVYNQQLGKCTITAEAMNCPDGKLWDDNKQKCVDKGMSTTKVVLIAGAAAGGGAVLGYLLKKCKPCNTVSTNTPIKTLPTTGSNVPVRPRIIVGYTSGGLPIWGYAPDALSGSSNNNNNSSGQTQNMPKTGQVTQGGKVVKTVIL